MPHSRAHRSLRFFCSRPSGLVPGDPALRAREGGSPATTALDAFASALSSLPVSAHPGGGARQQRRFLPQLRYYLPPHRSFDMCDDGLMPSPDRNFKRGFVLRLPIDARVPGQVDHDVLTG